MTDPLFFKQPVGLTVGEIAALQEPNFVTGLASITSLQISHRSIEQARPTSPSSTPPNTPTT